MVTKRFHPENHRGGSLIFCASCVPIPPRMVVELGAALIFWYQISQEHCIYLALPAAGLPGSRQAGVNEFIMQLLELKTRPSKCSNRWYPRSRSPNPFNDKPLSSAIISPHAGFDYSGQVSLEAVSHLKKNRIWFFGTSHYERLSKGISIFYGNYTSSIGKVVFPGELDAGKQKIIEKYLSNEGHRTEEHSIENVLYSVNHFAEEIQGFCVLVQIDSEKDFDAIADDIAGVWEEGDSVVVSTDWNHFVSTRAIDRMMKDVESYLTSGELDELYKQCLNGKIEACGIDGLYLAYKILKRTNENIKFVVLRSTDSSKTGEESQAGTFASTCVGYIAARN